MMRRFLAKVDVSSAVVVMTPGDHATHARLPYLFLRATGLDAW
jgi:hypothetical protein